MKGLIRRLSNVDWPPGAMLLLEDPDYEEIRKELLEAKELNYVEIRGLNRSTLEICSIVVYDHGAYKRANEWVNERLRPRGVQMVPYDCVGADVGAEPCGHKILLVTSEPTQVVLCDECGGKMERTVS